MGAVLAALLARPDEVAAHAQLESSSPPADALLAVPPAEVVLRFSEPVDPAAVAVQLVDEDGTVVAAGRATVDAGDPRTLRAEAGGVGFGITTVSWTSRSATDGHTLSGSFAFRVGGSSRAPAAATVEGDRPAPWDVATRWLTFLGLALAVGSAMVATTPRRRTLVLVGAGVALAASLAEPLLLSLAPPAGWESPGLGEAFGAQPWAWWLRPAGALAVLGLVALPGVIRSRRPGPNPRAEVGLPLQGSSVDGGLSSDVLGCAPTGGEGRGQHSLPGRSTRAGRYATAAAGLVGLLGLGLTAHAAGRESLRAPALLSVVLHEWSVALWVGGLILLALDRAAGWTADLGGFSRRVLPVALLAIATGAVNAGFLYPSVDRLKAIRESDYGWVLIAKVAVVGVVLALAGMHRAFLAKDRAAGAFRLSLPAEAVAVGLVLVAASTLAMLAPPSDAQEEGATAVRLALPVDGSVDDDQLFVVLTVEPSAHERRRLTVSATDGAPVRTEASPDGGYALVEAPPVADLQLARVTLTSLTTGIAPAVVDLASAGDGTFLRDGFAFAVDGWWQADVTVRRAGVEDRTVTFYLLEPNPNLVGFAAVPAAETDPVAAAIQAGARARFDVRTSYAYTERLNAGNGGVEVIDTTYSANGGAPGAGAVEIRSSGLEMIRLGGKRYLRQGGGDWVETGDSPVLPPAEVAVDYDGAEQVRSAGQEEVAGELCDRVTFHVPATSVSEAWYVWWVSVETGEVRQEAMVSRAHYMVKRYTAVNEPTVIAAPV